MVFSLLLCAALAVRHAVASPAAFAAIGLSMEPRQAPGPSDMLGFLCDETPAVCSNMCYGAFCRNIGSTLVYDKADVATKRTRRKTAGCIASGGNRCSVNKGANPGLQCDEYPFASTSDGANAQRLNRCVPAGENRSQGGRINGFYRGSFCNGGPCTFQIGFGNPGGVDYCNTPTDSCPPDDVIDADTRIPNNPGPPQDGDDAEDGTDLEDIPAGQEEPQKRAVGSPEVAEIFRYRTKLGYMLVTGSGAWIGQRTWWTQPRNATLWQELIDVSYPEEGTAEDDYEDYLADNVDMIEDYIVERLP